jgi:hypothetical protein
MGAMRSNKSTAGKGSARREARAIVVILFAARAALLVAAFFAAAPLAEAAGAETAAASCEPGAIVLYLARRRWHTDIGFAAKELNPALAPIAQRFPRAKYVFFGFGDRHYLLSKRKGTSTLAGALLPGAGLILVTAIENAPAQAFGASHVIEFTLSLEEAKEAQAFVRRTLRGSEDEIPVLAEGPYEESAYYDAVPRYSALHTCNTWAAETLKAAGLEVHTHFELFAWQTWNQARKIDARRLNRRAADCRSGTRPSSSSLAGPRPSFSAEEADSSC